MPSPAALGPQILTPGSPGAANTFGASGGLPATGGLPQQPGLPGGNVIPLITHTDDGGVDIEVVEPTVEAEPAEFSDNLAETMEESALALLAEYVMDGRKADVESRSEWYGTLMQGLTLLGMKLSDRNTPFEGASGVFDTLMLEAVLRNQAQTAAELLPAAGPVKAQVVGVPNEATEQQAGRIADFMNWWFTEACPEWVESHEQMYLWRAIAGSVFTKTYQDPILHRPVSPWLGPNQLIISYNADPEMESCQRVTEVMTLTFKEIRERQLSGFYRDISLMPPEKTDDANPMQAKVDSITGVQPSNLDSQYMFDKDFEVLEQHVDLDLESFSNETPNYENPVDPNAREKSRLPLPYIVTVETTTRKVLAIRRNWREGDDTFQKLQYYTHHRLIPGLGFYGIGYAHILGNPAKAATALQRQMIDAATLEMFPGGLRVKGMRMDDNNKMVGPCQFVEIDTGGLAINQAVAPMPYKGPSQWSFELWKAGRENAQSLGNMADISVGDGRQDAPVGTTLALLEAANRMMSATIKTAHRSLRREFKLFAALFGQYLPEKPYPFPVPGGMKAIMRQDFSDAVDVIPVSDPNITSYAQRVTRAEMMLRSALQAPQIHDLRAAYRNMYVEAGVDERKIEAILPPPTQAVPMDPLTENQFALTGKPIAVAPWQDHQAHIKSHQLLAEQVPTITAHIAEHLAMSMRVQVEKILGIQLPPPEQLLKAPPQVQNQIAVLVAQAMEHLQVGGASEPTPGQIAMAEIQVEAQKVAAQLEKIRADAANVAYKEMQANARNDEDNRVKLAQEQIKAAVKLKSDEIKAAAQKKAAAIKPKPGAGASK